jgi:DNA helicase-2/ATP-dependent DNA helicase PcrA
MDLFAGPSNDLAEAVLDGLNERQREAVRHDGGPLLVLAGAGSGKTRVLTRRVAWLIAHGVPPGSILAVTFTNKAAGEMRERIAALVGERARWAWVGTFHSIGVRILRREAARVGIARDFSIFDRDDQISALRRAMVDLGVPPKENPPEQILAVISKAKNDLRTPEEFEASARGPWERLVARVWREYAARLRAQSALDFDDLLVLPVTLLRDEDVRRRYAQLFARVLVDEYQDTNRCQYELLRAVTRDHRQLFVVGDDDQSIYRWRGADLSNILDFEEDHPDARVIRLEQNYRSTKTILDAANSLIRNNVGRKGKELWTENDRGDRILALEVSDEQAEAMVVLRFVKEGLSEGGRSPEDFVVLYRTNAQSRALENAFQLGQVPYQIFGGLRFYERKEIKDVLAYLRLLVNPRDDVAVERVINVPGRGVGRKTLEDLRADAAAQGGGLLAAVRRAAAGEGAAVRPAVRAALESFVDVLGRAEERARVAAAAEVTEALLQDVGYEQYLEEEYEQKAVSRSENVAELLAGMQEFADTPGREDASPAAFLQEVSLLTDADDVDRTAPRVTLMTLHNAKGLEFPWVFITGLEEGLFPHANSAMEPEGLEEERRLFYVGITRARARVVLLNAEARRRYDGFHRSIPSRFLEEIDPTLVERQSLLAAARGYAAAGAGPPPVRSAAMDRRAASSPAWGRREERDFLPSYEEESQVGSALEPGMRVKHPSWGEGILEAVEGRGENLKLTIRFRGGILKKVLAIYAKLELLG